MDWLYSAIYAIGGWFSDVLGIEGWFDQEAGAAQAQEAPPPAPIHGPSVLGRFFGIGHLQIGAASADIEEEIAIQWL